MASIFSKATWCILVLGLLCLHIAQTAATIEMMGGISDNPTSTNNRERSHFLGRSKIQVQQSECTENSNIEENSCLNNTHSGHCANSTISTENASISRSSFDDINRESVVSKVEKSKFIGYDDDDPPYTRIRKVMTQKGLQAVVDGTAEDVVQFLQSVPLGDVSFHIDQGGTNVMFYLTDMLMETFTVESVWVSITGDVGLAVGMDGAHCKINFGWEYDFLSYPGTSDNGYGTMEIDGMGASGFLNQGLEDWNSVTFVNDIIVTIEDFELNIQGEGSTGTALNMMIEIMSPYIADYIGQTFSELLETAVNEAIAKKGAVPWDVIDEKVNWCQLSGELVTFAMGIDSTPQAGNYYVAGEPDWLPEFPPKVTLPQQSPLETDYQFLVDFSVWETAWYTYDQLDFFQGSTTMLRLPDGTSDVQIVIEENSDTFERGEKKSSGLNANNNDVILDKPREIGDITVEFLSSYIDGLDEYYTKSDIVQMSWKCDYPLRQEPLFTGVLVELQCDIDLVGPHVGRKDLFDQPIASFRLQVEMAEQPKLFSEDTKLGLTFFYHDHELLDYEFYQGSPRDADGDGEPDRDNLDELTRLLDFLVLIPWLDDWGEHIAVIFFTFPGFKSKDAEVHFSDYIYVGYSLDDTL